AGPGRGRWWSVFGGRAGGFGGLGAGADDAFGRRGLGHLAEAFFALAGRLPLDEGGQGDGAIVGAEGGPAVEAPARQPGDEAVVGETGDDHEGEDAGGAGEGESAVGELANPEDKEGGRGQQRQGQAEDETAPCEVAIERVEDGAQRLLDLALVSGC